MASQTEVAQTLAGLFDERDAGRRHGWATGRQLYELGVRFSRAIVVSEDRPGQVWESEAVAGERIARSGWRPL